MGTKPDRAVRRTQTKLSPIWIVPLVAVLIGLWMLYDSYASRGPLVTLTMDSAEGIEAGKTPVKSRSVQVGQVKNVKLSDDFGHAIVEVRMSQDTERMLNNETLFWVVKPRIGREGISGLSTVLSGAYIELYPGNGSEDQRRFEVLDTVPVTPADAEGLRLTLVSQNATSLRAGDPVTYQGFIVGRVEDTQLDPDSREIVHRVYVEKEYQGLVTDTTRFWNASGINVRMDSEGLTLEMESLESILSGGVTFGVPEEVVAGGPVANGHSFTLYSDRGSARQGTYDRFLQYVLLVDASTRGLTAGAPVEYRGVRVGTVISVPWRFTAPKPEASGRLSVPVLIQFEPQRFDDTGGDFDMTEWSDRLERMFERGLRATLRTGNYLTQSLYVDLQFIEGAPPYTVIEFQDKPVFPTTAGGLEEIGAQVSQLLAKLNSLPIEPVLGGLEGNLKVSEDALRAVRDAAEATQELLSAPALKDAPTALTETLRELRATLQGFSQDSPLYRELSDTLKQLNELIDELQPVARNLRDKPSSLFFDRPGAEDVEPRAPR